MKNLKNKIIEIFTDGGSRGNPGPAAISFVMYDTDGEKIEQYSKYIGENTNNYAEYFAIIEALASSKKYDPYEITVYTDSSLAYNQINGYWKIKDDCLKKMVLQIRKEAEGLKQFKVVHISRDKNKEADRLVNIELNLSSIG